MRRLHAICLTTAAFSESTRAIVFAALAIVALAGSVTANIDRNSGRADRNELKQVQAVSTYQIGSSGIPVYVEGALATAAASNDEYRTVQAFLEANKSAYKMSDPADEIVQVRTDVDQIGMRHVRLQQEYRGLPVIGGQMVAHFTADGVLQTVNGTYLPKIDLETVASIASDRAITLGRDDLKTFFGDGEPGDAELVVFPWEGTNYLAWRFFLHSSTPMGRWEYFVDARSGEVIYKANRIMNDEKANNVGTGTGVMGVTRTHIDTDYNGSTYRMIDYTRRAANNPHGHNGQMPSTAYIQTNLATTTLPGSVATDADNAWTSGGTQAPAVDGHVYTAAMYDWMLSVFDRNSFDDNGATMLTSVNYSAEGNDNAYWNGSQIVIWSWSSGWRSLAGCPDVISHEWGHAITEKCSNLVYEKEPGALNESFSDMVGAAFEFAHDSLDTPDWLMGENGQTSGDGFRSMSTPHTYEQPDYYGTSDSYWYNVTSCTPSLFNDYCGVHTNSGVGNKWFYLLSDGGTHHSITVTGIGVENAILIAYRANAYYWNTNTGYVEGALGTISAAYDLDPTGAWATQVARAWNAVGVSTPSAGILFTYPSGVPATTTPGSTTSFDVVVGSYLGGVPVSGTGQLHYKVNSGTLQTVSMSETTANHYTATLPAMNCGDEIKFYVSATEATAGRLYDPDPDTPNVAVPATGEDVAFEDNFETNKGWTAGGAWSRGTPTGGGGSHGNPDPSSAHGGSNVFGYNLSGDYANNLAETHLTSPVIDCSDLVDVHLTFWRWLGVEQPSYDHAYVRVSTNGSTWTTIWQNTAEVTDASWTYIDLDISSVAAGHATVYVRFTMGTTDNAWTYCGWNVDDLAVSGVTCSAVQDTDGDGVPDGSDNCPTVYNPEQTDADSDTFGAACDCNDANAAINPNTLWYQDNDADTFGNPSVTLRQCAQPSGYVLVSGDCNDADAALNPNTIWYRDADGDTFGNPAVTLTQCAQPSGYVRNNTDCNDASAAVNPNTIWYQDSDADTFGNPSVTLTQCAQPSGYVLVSGDCNDADASLNPSTIWYRDADGDTFGSPSQTMTQCLQPSGYVRNSSDCNDADAQINPNTVWYQDSDGDTYGNATVSLVQCQQPAGYVRNSTDCNDGNAALNPATIWYQDVDNDTYGNPSVTLTQCEQPSGYVLDHRDCNDSDPNLNPTTLWYRDSDGDSYGDPTVTLQQCVQPSGYVLSNTDCNDSNVAINPQTVWYYDSDQDGHGTTEVSIVGCLPPFSYVLDSSDNCPAVANPDQDDIDGDTVGTACDNCPNTPNRDQADSDDDGTGDVCESCCTPPTVGNVDNSEDGLVGMGDLTVLIDNLFITLAPLGCSDEGNLDGSEDGLVTMGDLTVMIDHLFITLAPLSSCPQ
jgi:Zn-dependent metalloprotease